LEGLGEIKAAEGLAILPVPVKPGIAAWLGRLVAEALGWRTWAGWQPKLSIRNKAIQITLAFLNGNPFMLAIPENTASPSTPPASFVTD
jgi:hypothetical protein